MHRPGSCYEPTNHPWVPKRTNERVSRRSANRRIGERGEARREGPVISRRSTIPAVSTLATNCRGTGHQSTPFTSNPIFIFMRPVQDQQTTKSGTKTEVVIGIVEFQEFASLGLSHPLPKSTYRRCPNIRLLLVIPDKGLVVDGVIGHIVFSEFRVSSRGAGREQEAAADGWAWRMTEGDGGLLGLIGAYWGSSAIMDT